jgi:glycolate oxidase FAD binding subunit
MAERERATASIVLGEDERAAWVEHVRRPWAGDGAVVRISVLPAAVVPMAEWLIGAFDGAEIVGRVGVLLARIGGDAHEQARAITELRGRIPAGQGSAVVVRGSDELKSRIDVWGPIGDGLPMMRAIKQQFDPRAILNPGRGPGGL